jgi:Tfp pilus assembly protein PilF
MEDLNKAIELEPRLVVAYQARAKVWEALGRNDKARDDDDRADALMGKKPK